jgi:rubredoxin
MSGMYDKPGPYVCTVCGWTYDPKDGHPEDGIAPGTEFVDAPNDFVCPRCGVEKELFIPKD